MVTNRPVAGYTVTDDQAPPLGKFRDVHVIPSEEEAQLLVRAAVATNLTGRLLKVVI